MRQQLLEPIGNEPVEGVVQRLGAVQAQDESGAKLAIRTRRKRSKAHEVAEALAGGRVAKTQNV